MITPRSYQQTAIDFLHEHKRALISDAPGLGKTIIGISAATGPTLIACPAYLADQWYHTLVDADKYAVYYKDVAPVFRRSKYMDRLHSDAQYTIVTHGMLRRDDVQEVAKSGRFETMIIDESHHMRRHQSKQTSAAFGISRKIPNIYELSATPIYTSPADLWAQLHILDRARFHSYWMFVDRYCYRNASGILVARRGYMHDALEKTLDEYRLGRTYDDPEVSATLPPVIPNTIRVEMDKPARDMYNEIRYSYRLSDITFENASMVLHMLRAATALFPGKLDALCNVIEDIPPGKPVVVYTYYQDIAMAVRLHLQAKFKVPVQLITGSQNPSQRARNAADKSVNITVATLKSVSEGIDLSHMRNVIYYESPYEYGLKHQTMSRVVRDRRDGNESPEPVIVTTIITDKTIDVRIFNTVQERTETAESLLRKELPRG